MNTELAEKLEALSVELSRMMAHTPGELTCRKGCWACCYEAVYATAGEAQLIVDHVSQQGPAAVQELRESVNAWMRRFMLSDLWDISMPQVLPYRSMRLKCPLLAEDGSCSVYAVRPFGCRMHMTRSPKAGCEDLTQRGRAKYVDPMATAIEFGHTNVLFAMNEVMLASKGDEEGFTTEHLVVLLSSALGLPTPASGSRTHWPEMPKETLHG